MARRSGKEVVNHALTRLTGYHLAKGKPGSFPPAARNRIQALRVRAERAEARAERLEERLANSRRRVEHLERQVRQLRDGPARRAKFKPVWPLERNGTQESVAR